MFLHFRKCASEKICCIPRRSRSFSHISGARAPRSYNKALVLTRRNGSLTTLPPWEPKGQRHLRNVHVGLRVDAFHNVRIEATWVVAVQFGHTTVAWRFHPQGRIGITTVPCSAMDVRRAVALRGCGASGGNEGVVLSAPSPRLALRMRVPDASNIALCSGEGEGVVLIIHSHTRPIQIGVSNALNVRRHVCRWKVFSQNDYSF